MNKKGIPWAMLLNEKYEIRNECWNCGNYFVFESDYFMPKEQGQKQYIICNYCGKINHT